MVEKRKNNNVRAEYDKAKKDLKELLPCYTKALRYQVIISYLKTYNLLNGAYSARGHLLYELGQV